MRAYLLTLIIASTLPFILAKPHFGILVYSWFSYMNPHRLAFYGIVQHIPFALILAVVTIGAWLISRESKKLPLTALSGMIIVFTLWINLTTVFAIVPESANIKWETVIKIMLITFLTMILITTRERLNALIWVIVLSLGYYGVKGGIFMLLTGGNYRVWGPENSFIEDNNALALALIMTLPLMRYLQLHAPQRLIRIGLLGAMLLCGLSVFGSFSRGAALAGVAMLVVLWLRSRQRAKLGIVVVAFVALAAAFMPQSYYDRLATLQTVGEDDSANSRLDTWQFTYDFARSRPLIGGGFSVFDSEEIREEFAPGTDLFNAHSIWFEVLGEHGFVGLALFLIIGLLALATCGRVRRNTRGNPQQLWAFDVASNLQVTLVGFAVGGTFLNKAFFDLYWQILAVVVVLTVVLKREIAAQEAPKAEAKPSLYHRGRHAPVRDTPAIEAAE